MRSKYIGIEEARKTLGDLVTAAQQGTDIILTRNRRPVARITRHQEDAVTTIAERYADADTCECGDPIECLDGGGYSYWVHVKRMSVDYDHAAVPAKEEQ